MTTLRSAGARHEVSWVPGWLGYEIRYLGWFGFALPCLVLLLFTGFAATLSLVGAPREQVARLLVTGLEMGLPYAAGIAAAAIVTRDPAVVLHLSAPSGARRTIGRRVLLLAGWTALIAAVTTLALWVTGLWQAWVPFAPWPGQLVWLAPLAWFTGAGLVLGLLLGSQTTASALLSGLWVFSALSASVLLETPLLRLEYLFLTTVTPGAEFWLVNRCVILATGMVLIALALGLATAPELHTRGEAA